MRQSWTIADYNRELDRLSDKSEDVDKLCSQVIVLESRLKRAEENLVEAHVALSKRVEENERLNEYGKAADEEVNSLQARLAATEEACSLQGQRGDIFKAKLKQAEEAIDVMREWFTEASERAQRAEAKIEAAKATPHGTLHCGVLRCLI